MIDNVYEGLVFLLIFCFICIFLFGIGDIFYAVKLYRLGDLKRLIYGIQKIKTGTILYHLIVFYVCLLFIPSIIQRIMPAERAMIIVYFLVFGVFLYLCIMIEIAMTGAYGIAYVKLFRKTYPQEKMGRIHYLFQILPLLDVISSHILVSQYKQFFSQGEL